jgi:peptidylprolyl isomerase
VRVEQAMWTGPGRLFQSSRLVGDFVRLPVQALLPGVREAMLKMVEGDKLRLWLPGKLAFGDPIPGQDPLPFVAPLGPLVVDLELIKIQGGRGD